MSSTKKQLENIAKSYETDFESVQKLFDSAIKFISAQGPIHETKLNARAVSAVKAYFAQRSTAQGKELNVIFFGSDRPRDNNSFLRKELQNRWDKSPKEKQAMMEEGWLMLMKTSEKDVATHPIWEVFSPVSRIKPNGIEISKSGIATVTDAIIWEPGQTPIFRDAREEITYGENTWKNSRYSQPITPYWSVDLFGVGHFEDTPKITKKVKVRYSGDYADPKSSKFILTKLRYFVPSKIKVFIQEDKCTSELYSVRSYMPPIVDSQVDVDVLALIESINKNLGSSVIPIVDLGEIKDFHLSIRALRDEGGKITKNKWGYDNINWDKYAIVTPTYLGVREYKNNFKQMIFKDASSDFFKMNFGDYIDSDLPVPSEVIISVKTSRGTTKYDPETKLTIYNSDDPDVMGEVCGIRCLSDLTKLMDNLEQIFKNRIVEGDI